MKRPCPEKPTAQRNPRAVIEKLFARGKADAAFQHRLVQCYHASKCGRLCERLVKSHGAAMVWCYDIETGERTHLYPALEREDFRCPEGRF